MAEQEYRSGSVSEKEKSTHRVPGSKPGKGNSAIHPHTFILLLRSSSHGQLARAPRVCKVIAVPQSVINPARDFRSVRAARRPAAATNQNHQHDLGVHFIRVGNEPA